MVLNLNGFWAKWFKRVVWTLDTFFFTFIRIHQIKQGEVKSILRQINLSLIFWMVMRCGRAHLGQRGQDISVNCPFDILFFSSSTSSLAWTTRKEIYNTIDLIHLFATDSGLPSPVLRLRICSLFLLSLSFSLMLVLCSSSWAVPPLATFPCGHPWGKAKWLQYYINESGSYC